MAREARHLHDGGATLYMQLTALDWPDGAAQHLRYWANTGGRMPRAALQRACAGAETKPYLMYGLTEAFRSTTCRPDGWIAAPTR